MNGVRPLTVLVVDDEPLAAGRLADLAARAAELQGIGEGRQCRAGLEPCCIA